MGIYANYLFKMYRPGHRVFRYKTFFAWDEREAIEYAGEWADCNGYIDFELVSNDRKDG